MEGIELEISARITLPEISVVCGSFGAHRVIAEAGEKRFDETIPAEIGRDGVNGLFRRLRDFLTDNAKVEFLQG
jgi:hypothetical protein